MVNSNTATQLWETLKGHRGQALGTDDPCGLCQGSQQSPRHIYQGEGCSWLRVTPTLDPRPRCHLTGVASEGSLGPAGDSVFCLAPGSALLDMPSSWLQWLGARQTSRGQVGRGSSQLCLYWCRQGRGVQRTRQSCVLNPVALCAQPLWVLLGVILCDRLSWGDTSVSSINDFWLASHSAS